jgi:type I restriction enzyme, S subunit
MEILGKYIDIFKGKLPKNLSDNFDESFFYPYVDIKAFEKGDIQRYTDGDRCLICEKGDLLIVWDGARCGFVGKAIKGAVGSTLAIIKPKEALIKDYLFYYLKSKFRTFNTKVKGIGIPHLDPQIILNSELLIPNLEIQHRIVSKLEELFSSLDSAVAALRKAKEQVKTYKQAVLSYAFSGKLKIKNEELRINEETGLPEGWKWVKLQNVCLKIQDGSHFSPKEQFDEPDKNRYKYITAKNIRNNFMDFRKVTYVNEEFHKSIYGRCNPEYGDVLLTKDGINTGDVCVNTINEPISLLSSVCLIKAIHEKVNSRFIVYFFQSNIGNRNLIGDMTGTAIKRIILKKIKETNIIIPPIIEQQQIVAEIETRFSEAENLEKTIDLSLKQAESLRQSILKKAFEGRLVPQDPEDEPASLLLDRIKN